MRQIFFRSCAALLAVLATGCGDEFDELEADPEVVATGTQALTTSNCTTLSVSAASANGHDGNVPANVLDDTLGTRWSQLGKGAWLQLDLGSARGVGAVAVAWHNGNQRRNNYVLSVSTDGVSFTQVRTGQSGLTTAAETYGFTGRSARYVRVTVNGNTLNDWASIAEARVCSGTVPAPAPAPAPAPGGVVWREDFESGTYSTAWRTQMVSADRLQVQSSVVREGRYGLKTTVYQGDDPINASGNRNELVRMTREPAGSEYFYRFSVMFPTSYPSANTWQLFVQWHHDGNNYSPPLEFVVRGEELQLVTNTYGTYNGQKIVWRTKLVRGAWQDFILHVKWSSSASTGFLELYHNGALSLPRTPAATQYPGQLNYLKVGLYRNDTIAPVGIVYHDGWVVGRTLADVQ